MTKVYLAGKIGHTDWRHELFDGLRSVDAYHYGNAIAPGPAQIQVLGNEWPLERDGFEYAGPFFMSCDHGCAHGDDNHGLGTSTAGCIPETPHHLQVANWCKDWLLRSQVVFCWLTEPDAYGTLIELGFAHAHGLPIFLAYPYKIGPSWFSPGIEDRFFADTWFARTLAARSVRAQTVLGAWTAFGVWWSQKAA